MLLKQAFLPLNDFLTAYSQIILLNHILTLRHTLISTQTLIKIENWFYYAHVGIPSGNC